MTTLTKTPDGGRPLTPHARFEEMYIAEAAGVLRYARYRVGQHLAEDIADDTFAIAWQKLARVPDPSRPWLLATAAGEREPAAGAAPPARPRARPHRRRRSRPVRHRGGGPGAWRVSSPTPTPPLPRPATWRCRDERYDEAGGRGVFPAPGGMSQDSACGSMGWQPDES